MRKILLVLVLFFSMCLIGCSEPTFDEESGVLRVGLECAYAPFNWTETEKTDSNVPISNASNMYADGYDVQIAKLIADDLGYELEIQMIEWDGLVIALKSGTIDLIIAGMSPTEERKESISFTNPYYTSTHVLVMKEASQYASAKTFNDLSGATIIGQSNTVYDDLAVQINEKNAKAKRATPLESVPLIINAINSDTSNKTITVLEEPVAKGIVTSQEGYVYIQLEEQFELDEADKVVSIGVRKSDDKLLEKVNESLAKIQEATRQQLMENAVNSGN